MGYHNFKKADVRFNGGHGALLCNNCRIILKYGLDHEDKIHYCDSCKEGLRNRLKEIAGQFKDFSREDIREMGFNWTEADAITKIELLFSDHKITSGTAQKSQ